MYILESEIKRTELKAPNLGIKRMQANNLDNPSKQLKYHCTNCKCKRYNPCTCRKNG